MAKKPKLETVKSETEKKGGIINSYPNEQLQRIKQSNLCRNEINL